MPYQQVPGKPPFAFCVCMGTRNLVANPKRRSGGALQNLADLRAAVTNAPASWSAAVFRRFRRASGLGIRAVDEKLSKSLGRSLNSSTPFPAVFLTQAVCAGRRAAA